MLNHHESKPNTIQYRYLSKYAKENGEKRKKSMEIGMLNGYATITAQRVLNHAMLRIIAS